MTAALPDETHVSPGALRRSLTIGTIGFLTLVDLFATQAILPALARSYGVTPAADRRRRQRLDDRHGDRRPAGRRARAQDRPPPRRLAEPRLARHPDDCCSPRRPTSQSSPCCASPRACAWRVPSRLTLAYLGERCSKADAAGALAAYVTGGVASNLIGRLCAATVASFAGAEATFWFFAALNLAGAAAGLSGADRHAADDRDGRARPPPLVRLGRASRAIRSCAAPSRSAS